LCAAAIPSWSCSRFFPPSFPSSLSAFEAAPRWNSKSLPFDIKWGSCGGSTQVGFGSSPPTGSSGCGFTGLVERSSELYASVIMLSLAWGDRVVRDRDPKLLVETHDQIATPPTHHSINRRDRGPPPQCERERPCAPRRLGRRTRRVNVDEPCRPLRVEPDHPIPQRLAVHPATRRSVLLELQDRCTLAGIGGSISPCR
jgi:hypothetical protein